MLILKTDSPDKHDMAIFLRITKEEICFNSINVTLSDLKARNDFKPFCSYMFPVSFLSTLGQQNGNLTHMIEGEEKLIHYWVATPNPLERFAESHHNKLNNIFPHLSSVKIVLQIVFYPETKNFEDALIILNQQTKESLIKITTLDHNGNEQPLEPDYIGPFNVIIPKCELSMKDSKIKAKGSEIQFTYKNRLRRICSC